MVVDDLVRALCLSAREGLRMNIRRRLLNGSFPMSLTSRKSLLLARPLSLVRRVIGRRRMSVASRVRRGRVTHRRLVRLSCGRTERRSSGARRHSRILVRRRRGRGRVGRWDLHGRQGLARMARRERQRRGSRGGMRHVLVAVLRRHAVDLTRMRMRGYGAGSVT